MGEEWVGKLRFSASLMAKPHPMRSYPIGGRNKRSTMRRLSTWQRWQRKRKFANATDIGRFSLAVCRLRRTDMSGCGSIHAALTSKAVQSYPRPLIPCIDGTKMREYAMRTSMTPPIHCFRLCATRKGIAISMAGLSGSHVGGHYKS